MGIGMKELLIILLVVLLVFGAKRLRSIGSDLGAAVHGYKKSGDEGDDEQSTKLPHETLSSPEHTDRKV